MLRDIAAPDTAMARINLAIQWIRRDLAEPLIAHLIPLLEAWNPGDREPIHAVFVGGSAMPARVRLFVDFLLEQHRM